MSELITGYAIGMLVVAFVAWLKNRPVLELVGWSLLVSPLLVLIWLIFSPTLEVFKFQGSKNLDNESYKIYLTKQYKISKIDTINKFECFGKTFETADDALGYAFKHDCGFASDYVEGENIGVSTSQKLLNEKSTIEKKITGKKSELNVISKIFLALLFIVLITLGIKFFKIMIEVSTPVAKESIKESIKESLSPPLIKQGESYETVRQTMFRNGWKPFTFPADRHFYCGDSDTRCQSKPETEACSGGGMSACKYMWVKNGIQVNVCTWGEDNVFNEYCK